MPIHLPEATLAAIALCPIDVAREWSLPLERAMVASDIDTVARAAAFLAQVVHESNGLTTLVENLDYSATRLAQVWPRRFRRSPEAADEREDAALYAHRPEALANLVYANRLGNGSSVSGDGWRYRGRGLMQITGRHAYSDTAQALGIDIVAEPDLLLLPIHATGSAAWYWLNIDGNDFADQGSEDAFERLTRAINGALIGLENRVAAWTRAKRHLAVANSDRPTVPKA